jgi:hypothetical protein
MGSVTVQIDSDVDIVTFDRADNPVMRAYEQ